MTIRVGLIGFGLSGRVFHAPLIDFVPGLTLAAVVSSQVQAVHQSYPEVPVLSTMAELLARQDIDLVVITTPNNTHFDLARQAIMYGKAVVVEKPFTVTAAEADELIALAKEHRVVLSVYQNRRWDGDFLDAKEAIESGDLGDIAVFESHFDRFRPEVKDRWKERDESGAGALYDLGSHLIDQTLCLFGAPEAVYADLATQRSGATTIDWFHLILKYGQMRAILHSGSLVAQLGPRFAIHGSTGSFVKFGLDPQEAALGQGVPPSAGTVGYHTFYEGMVAALNTGVLPPVRPDAARDVIRVIECALASSAAGKVVPFDSSPREYRL